MPDFSIEKAARHLVGECASYGMESWHHAIMITTVVNQRTAEVDSFIKVHIRPGFESKWRNRDKHLGYRVEVHPWPADEQ